MGWEMEGSMGCITLRSKNPPSLEVWSTGPPPARVCPLYPHPGTLPSHPGQDPEVKLLGVTAQRRRCAPPRPSGHCSPAGSPSTRATSGRKLGEEKGKCPAGQSTEHGLLTRGCPLVTTSGNLERHRLYTGSQAGSTCTSHQGRWVSLQPRG